MSEELTLPSPLLDPSYCGYRRAINSCIYVCACGCGGHVAIQQPLVGVVGLARRAQHDLADRLTRRVYGNVDSDGNSARRFTAAWGSGWYIHEHEPMGVVQARTGVRVALKATS